MAQKPANNTGGGAETITRVLVVDDEELVRVALGRGLRRLGCEVLEAAGAEAGLTLVMEERPSVIFLDLRMPGVDGHTFLRRLRGLECDAAVVVVSGDGIMDDVIEVLRVGAVDYLKKPWTPAEMMAALTRAVEVNEMRVAWRSAEQLERVEVAPPPAWPAVVSPAPSTFEQLLTRLRDGDLTVPSSPVVLEALRTMVRDPKADVDDIVAKIEQDQRLAGDLVRLSNTAQFARCGRNASVKAAVTRLGLRQVHGLVETLFLKAVFPGHDGRVKERLSRIWHHAVARGIAMRGLSDLLAIEYRVNADSAYLMGLMVDVGASFLLWVAGEKAGALGTAGEGAVMAIVHKHHQELSGLILARWNFDPDIVALVQYHHADVPASMNRPYWPMSTLAGHLACEITGIDDITQGEPENAQRIGQCGDELRIGSSTLARLVGTLKKEYLSMIDGVGETAPQAVTPIRHEEPPTASTGSRPGGPARSRPSG